MNKNINKPLLFVGKLLICVSLLYPILLFSLKEIVLPLFGLYDLYNMHYISDGYDGYYLNKYGEITLLLFIIGVLICFISTKNQIDDEPVIDDSKPLIPFKQIFSFIYLDFCYNNMPLLFQKVFEIIIWIWTGLIIISIIAFAFIALAHEPEAVIGGFVMISFIFILLHWGWKIYKGED